MGKRTYSNTAKRQTERFAKLFNRCPSLLEHIRRVECKANTLESKSGTFGLQKMEKILYFILNYDLDRFDIFLSRSYIKYEFVTKSAIFHITDFYNFSPKNITAFDETEHRMNQSLSTLSKKTQPIGTKTHPNDDVRCAVGFIHYSSSSKWVSFTFQARYVTLGATTNATKAKARTGNNFRTTLNEQHRSQQSKPCTSF